MTNSPKKIKPPKVSRFTRNPKYEILPEPREFSFSTSDYASHNKNDPKILQKGKTSGLPKTESVLLFRIRALRDIPENNVKAGDLGGWVTSEGILSHEGSAWIGGEAKVVSGFRKNEMFHVTERVKVYERALVTDNATVIVNASSKESGYGLFIHDDAIISGNASVIHTIESSRLAGITSYALITEDAIVCTPLTIDGTIRGRAYCYPLCRTSSDSLVGDDAIIGEESDIYHAKVTGKALVGSQCYLGERTVVSDNAIIGESSKIARNSIVKDSARVISGSKVPENTFLSGNMVASPGPVRGLSEIIISKPNGKSVVRNRLSETVVQKQLPEAPSESTRGIAANDEISDAESKFASLKFEIESYTSDIVKIIKYPVFADSTDDYTRAMNVAFRKVNGISPQKHPEKFEDAVDDLEEKFLAAEANALKMAASLLSEGERKKIELSQQLFNVVMDEKSSETEKKGAFKQAFRNLEGVVVIPEIAITTLRHKSGLLELEAGEL